MGDLAATFWSGAAAGVLRYRRCRSCGSAQSLPRPVCAGCGGIELAWHDAAGTGTVHALTEVARAPDERWRALVPYTIVLVDLDEGARLMAHGAEGLAIGARVRVAFRDFDGRSLPIFHPL